VRTTRRTKLLFAPLLTLAIVAAACGGGDDETTGTTSATGDEGGELIDLGTFSSNAPEHIDPGLNSELDSYQVVNALYDGLTEIDFSDPDNPEVKGLAAEKFEANADATVWTFTIKKGLNFSNGEPVLPSSFVRGWERASGRDLSSAGDYSYLFKVIQGGAEKLAGTAPTLAGVKADDAAMTLEVTLASPYANFPAVAGFQTFSPVPKATESLANQADWEKGVMIGNGPYKMEKPKNDQEIVLVRNDRWDGDIFGNERAKLDKITFKISQDIESAYNAFEAGEGDIANVPPGRYKEAGDNYETTADTDIIGSYFFNFDMNDPVVGGANNKLLRQAISQAIDRESINKAAYDGIRTISTGITPKGIPGFEEGLCDYCAYDKDAAQKAFNDWKAAGNSQSGPIKVNFNTDAGQEPVAAIVVDNLKAIGIDAVADPLDGETYFSMLSDGACQFCRVGWYADYPIYDNFMFDLFHSSSIGGNNLGPYNSPRFDALVDEAKRTLDQERAADLNRQAERVLLNDDIGTVPFNWYKGDYVYNPDKVNGFEQNPLGLIPWELLTVNS
jgi:ABC-type oligopeptide transport system substrate-binding subunit